jgi:hypothetical protein
LTFKYSVVLAQIPGPEGTRGLSGNAFDPNTIGGTTPA